MLGQLLKSLRAEQVCNKLFISASNMFYCKLYFCIALEYKHTNDDDSDDEEEKVDEDDDDNDDDNILIKMMMTMMTTMATKSTVVVMLRVVEIISFSSNAT